MPAVDLYISDSLANSNTTSPSEIGDSLAGTGTGLNYGQCANGEFAPITDKDLNTGHQTIYLSHNAIVDPIVDLKVFLDTYSQVYGGPSNRNAANDIADILDKGNSSGDSLNNADGLSEGVWIDWSYGALNQFDKAGRPSEVQIFGDNGGSASGEGKDAASAITIPTLAMIYAPDNVENNETSTTNTGAQAGKIGISDSGTGYAGDSTLGNRAKFKTRVYLSEAEDEGGIFQFDMVFRYSYTA